MKRRDPDFDASADMRLVELQRASLGVPAPERGVWRTNLPDEGEPREETQYGISGAILVCETIAAPDANVIPGAIVTVSVSVANEGTASAHNVRVAVPLPGGAGYRNGSFVQDGRPVLDDVAEEFFTTGLLLPEIAPKARATFLWKLGVRIGNKALVMAPVLSAGDSAVLGAQPVIIARKEGAQAAFTAEIARAEPSLSEPAPQLDALPEELPIYELDREETIEYEAVQAALSDVAEYRPPVEPPPPPSVPAPAQPEPIPAPDQPEPVPEPGVPVVEPSMPEPPTQPPDMEPAAREAVILVGQIDRPSIAYFERIFNGSKPPTLLNHFILGGALACTRTQSGDDAAGLKAHLDAQGQLLQRIVLHEKMGKKEPIAEYAGEMRAQIDQLTPVPVVPSEAPADRNTVLLVSELDMPTLGVLSNMQQDPARWDFTKARQMTLALQARSVVANASQTAIDSADEALRCYAQTAGVQLQRFFVRMRIDRTTGLLYVSDEVLDESARALIAALIALF